MDGMALPSRQGGPPRLPVGQANPSLLASAQTIAKPAWPCRCTKIRATPAIIASRNKIVLDRLAKFRAMGLLAAGFLLGACVPDARQPNTSSRAGCDTSIRFENTSSITVTNLYYNPAPVATWGQDRLGQNVLRPGGTTNSRMSFARPYDFRIVWENGRSSELRNVDVCRVSHISITNVGLRAL